MGCNRNAICGDGEIQVALNEQCDNGAGNGDNNNCTSNCQDNVCGDGLLDTDSSGDRRIEACDDGNSNNNDDCIAGCVLNSCGDRFVDLQPPVVEDCDDGAVDSANCDFDCTSVECGDNHINSAAGEECEPPGGACDANCRFIPQ